MIEKYNQHFAFDVKSDLFKEEEYMQAYLLFYVVEGEVALNIDNTRLIAEADDILYVPAFHLVKEEKKSDLTAAVLMINCSVAELLAAKGSAIVFRNSSDYVVLKRLFTDLIYDYAAYGKAMTMKKVGYSYLVLDTLLSAFSLNARKTEEASGKEQQLPQVMNYIHSHFSSGLTQEEVSSAFFMSPPVFSKYFRKQTGTTFVEYVAEIRIEKACELLRKTDHKVVDIALECGFTSASAFNKVFKKCKSMSPVEYRNAFAEKGQQESEDKQIHEAVIKRFLESYVDESRTGIYQQKVLADAKRFQLHNRAWGNALNVGAAKELLSGQMQKHLLQLKGLLQCEYIRILNIFSEELLIRSEKKQDQLNFDMLDNVLDFLVENDFKVILDMGNKHKAILNAGSIRVYEQQQNIPILSLEDGEYVVERFVQHIIDRYGRALVENWIFEINYDNKIYQKQLAYNFLSYAKRILDCIKSFLPQAAVGINSSIMKGDDEYLIFKLSEFHIIPDFVSVGILPYYPQQEADGSWIAKKSMDPLFLCKTIGQMREDLKAQGLKNVLLFGTEWNFSISDRFYFNDSQEFAAQLLKMINEIYDVCDMAAYTFASDLSLRYFETEYAFFGGKGLISKDGLLKPACYALQLLRKLDKYVIQKGHRYILTTDQRGNYSCLCYNACDLSWQYYKADQEDKQQRIYHDYFTSEDMLSLTFHVQNVENGHYIMNSYILEKENSIIEQWEKLAKVKNLTKDDVEYLNQICIPRRSTSQVLVDHGMLTCEVVLKPHEIRFIHWSINKSIS